KTYGSRDSLVVTNLTTSPPVKDLSCREQTGPRVTLYLWLYVKKFAYIIYILTVKVHLTKKRLSRLLYGAEGRKRAFIRIDDKPAEIIRRCSFAHFDYQGEVQSLRHITARI
ncbi:hypothetical protein K458DRAFT_322509, partial [Lentithecium fluviatile CBS 122367]